MKMYATEVPMDPIIGRATGEKREGNLEHHREILDEEAYGPPLKPVALR